MTWQTDLLERYRNLFGSAEDPETLRGYPTVGDGWRAVVEKAVERIDAALAGGPGRVEIVQIKEKLGGLRMYFHSRDLSAGSLAKVREAIDLAEARADCTCETCGAPGRLYDKGGWLSTRCELHAAGKLVLPRDPEPDVHIKWTIEDGRMRVISCRRYDRARDVFVDAPLPKDLKGKKGK